MKHTRRILAVLGCILLSGCATETPDSKAEFGKKILPDSTIRDGYYISESDDSYIFVSDGTIELCGFDFESFYRSRPLPSEVNAEDKQAVEKFISESAQFNRELNSLKEYTVVEISGMGENGGALIMIATHPTESEISAAIESDGQLGMSGYYMVDEDILRVTESMPNFVYAGESLSDTSVTAQTTATVSDIPDIKPTEESGEPIHEDSSEEAEPVIPAVTESTTSTAQTSVTSTTVQTTTVTSTTAQTTVTTTTSQTENIPDEPYTEEYETWESFVSEEPYVEVPAEGDVYEPVIDIPVYSDKNLGDYVLLTVVPEKIYWNELDYFHPTEGEEFTMLFPSFFYETFKDSDSVVLQFQHIKDSYRDPMLTNQCGGCDFVYSYVRPSDSWEKDMLFPIKDGVLTKLEHEKYIRSYYNGYDAKSWVMSDHADEFYYGMTTDEVDAFMANQHAECVEAEEYWNKIIEEDPNNAVDFEMSHSYFTWGMVMRVRLAE